MNRSKLCEEICSEWSANKARNVRHFCLMSQISVLRCGSPLRGRVLNLNWNTRTGLPRQLRNLFSLLMKPFSLVRDKYKTSLSPTFFFRVIEISICILLGCAVASAPFSFTSHWCRGDGAGPVPEEPGNVRAGSVRARRTDSLRHEQLET